MESFVEPFTICTLSDWCCYNCTSVHPSMPRAFSDQLKDYDKKCEDLLKEIDTALDLFQDMKKKHSFVSTKTNALHNACQQLMDDETQLRNVADSITSKLAFFEDYDKVEHVRQFCFRSRAIVHISDVALSQSA